MNAVLVNREENTTVDIIKFIMAILVIGIHTEPFSFNIWLDRGYGIITRLCVPFFFIIGAYYFFLRNKPLKKYLMRILGLYVLWSIIYLPFDITRLCQMDVPSILYRYLWAGNEHALWYLWGTITATLIVYFLRKKLSTWTVLLISSLFLIVGCLGSTWSPLMNQLSIGGIIQIVNTLGCRNGLFYASVYVALGMYIAKKNTEPISEQKNVLGFIVSMLCLVVESIFCILVLHTDTTILWISVLPASYFLVRITLSVDLRISKLTAVFMRKVSTLIFVSHSLFIELLRLFGIGNHIVLFLGTAILSILFGTVVVKISEKVPILKNLY